MKRRRSSEEVANLVKEFRASGTSHREFAETKGVPLSTVSGWLRRAEKKSGTPNSTVALVPVVSGPPGGRSAVIRIDLPCGRRIELLGQVPQGLLSDVLAVLDPRAC